MRTFTSDSRLSTRRITRKFLWRSREFKVPGGYDKRWLETANVIEEMRKAPTTSRFSCREWREVGFQDDI